MKLKVGEIEMDTDTGIVFSAVHDVRGGGHVASSWVGRRRESSRPRSPSERTRALSSLVYWGVSSVGVMVAAALIVTSVIAPHALSFPALVGLLLPCCGLGIGGAAFAVRARDAEEAARTSPELCELRATRLAGLLSAATTAMTVEDLVAALGWTERAVVTGLARLVQQGRVDEDLDLDSGHWVYMLVPGGHTRAALPVEERVRALRSHNTK